MTPTPANVPASVWRGKWMEVRAVPFADRAGRAKVWEYAARTHDVPAAVLLATTAGPAPELLLVRQWRWPVRAFVVEFPAGLVDPGEDLPAAALRELREETGAEAELLGATPPATTTPGLATETVCLVRARVTAMAEHAPESDEEIEVLRVPVAGLAEFLRARAAAGDLVDVKVWAFAEGLAFPGRA